MLQVRTSVKVSSAKFSIFSNHKNQSCKIFCLSVKVNTRNKSAEELIIRTRIIISRSIFLENSFQTEVFQAKPLKTKNLQTGRIKKYHRNIQIINNVFQQSQNDCFQSPSWISLTRKASYVAFAGFGTAKKNERISARGLFKLGTLLFSSLFLNFHSVFDQTMKVIYYSVKECPHYI